MARTRTATSVVTVIGTRPRRLVTALLTSSLALAGCGSSTSPQASPSATAPAAASASLHVFAAASLHTTFDQLGKLFEADYPGTSVEFTFAGSSDLVGQLTQGASADVLATADTANMDKAAAAGLVGDAVDFASNTLTIVVAPGNPKHLTSLRDLSRPGLDVVVCAPQVPCGAAALKVEKGTGVQLNPVSEESSVTDVLNKVTSGQADAGLVYVTDAKSAAGKVAQVNFPESAGAVNTYPIAVTTDTRNPERAKQFVDLVRSDKGREILAGAGFAAP